MTRKKKSFSLTPYCNTLILALILLTSIVMASEGDDGQTSEYVMVSRDGIGRQGGTASWNTVVAPGITSRSLTADNNNIPIIANLINISQKEIVVQNGDQLTIYEINLATNAIQLVTSVDVGSMSFGITRTVNPSFAVMNSTITKIVTMNGSHILEYDFNGATLTLRNSYNGNGTNATATYNHHTTMMCDDSLNWADSDVHCFANTMRQDEAGNDRFLMLHLNVNDSFQDKAEITSIVFTANHQDLFTPKIVDFDVDGELDVVFELVPKGITPVDIFIFYFDVNGTGNATGTQLYVDNNAGAAETDYTDVLINNLDGTLTNGRELSWGYSSDGTNFFIRTISSTGVTLEAAYFSVLNALEGDSVVRNLVDHPDCGVSLAVNSQAAMVVHDSTTGQSGLACVSLFAGSDRTSFSYVDGSEVGSTSFMRAASLTTDSVYDVAYDNVILDVANEALLSFNFSGMKQVIPIDYEVVGTLDLLVSNGSRMFYYDDLILNANVVLDSLSWTTGNPVCNNTKNLFNLVVIDATNDLHTCNMNITFVNGTSVFNSSDSTGTAPRTHTFQYTFGSPNGNDAYTVRFACQDQFHEDWVTHDYSLWTATPPGCNNFNQLGDSEDLINVTGAATAQQRVMDESINTTLGILFGTSTTMRLIVAIGIIIAIMIMIGSTFKNGMAAIAGGILGAIMCTAIGLLSAYILILILVGMVLVLFVGRAIMGTSSGGGG